MDRVPDRSRGESNSTSAANVVATARGRRGMSQRELARAAGVPQSTVAFIESGRRQPSFAMVERLLDAAGFRLDLGLTNTIRPSTLLKRHAREVTELLSRYPLAGVWVFGSVARGDDRPDSDLDLLVELRSGFSVIDILGLEEELADLLGCPVDLITTSELSSNELLRRGVDRSRLPLTLAA
ncbi:helix-turn-helix domain-containing protein [Saccharomonospora iraqiensis]|uniref:helix-turn-helix domain-containing protein n=1 Tax=Saccharomonospora iraqiensis TaxID=52698 RepID=UPI000A0047F5|nr:helix-turn-helix domain-containing protein [Saccharomonospora iraqiensis]